MGSEQVGLTGIKGSIVRKAAVPISLLSTKVIDFNQEHFGAQPVGLGRFVGQWAERVPNRTQSLSGQGLGQLVPLVGGARHPS